ncbi:MAG TPA: 6-phosphogluconolactonase [Spongiibacteraceae bacterium]
MAIFKNYTQCVAGHTRRWHVCGDIDTLHDAIISQLSRCANEAIAERGAFRIVLAGGRTPQTLYRELPEIATDWRSWFIYFGDERCLPRGDAARNDTMAQQCWLDDVPIPPQQIFSIPAENGAEQGAATYAQLLANVPVFDLVLLGLGEDGHTASLFPDFPTSNAMAYAVHEAPKPPPDRITLSAARLSAARDVFFLVSGNDKRTALLRLQRGESIPAAEIIPHGGIDIYTDIEVN